MAGFEPQFPLTGDGQTRGVRGEEVNLDSRETRR